jgi:hypothetical protein
MQIFEFLHQHTNLRWASSAQITLLPLAGLQFLPDSHKVLDYQPPVASLYSLLVHFIALIAIEDRPMTPWGMAKNPGMVTIPFKSPDGNLFLLYQVLLTLTNQKYLVMKLIGTYLYLQHKARLKMSYHKDKTAQLGIVLIFLMI